MSYYPETNFASSNIVNLQRCVSILVFKGCHHEHHFPLLLGESIILLNVQMTDKKKHTNTPLETSNSKLEISGTVPQTEEATL